MGNFVFQGSVRNSHVFRQHYYARRLSKQSMLAHIPDCLSSGAYSVWPDVVGLYQITRKFSPLESLILQSLILQSMGFPLANCTLLSLHNSIADVRVSPRLRIFLTASLCFLVYCVYSLLKYKIEL